MIQTVQFRSLSIGICHLRFIRLLFVKRKNDNIKPEFLNLNIGHHTKVEQKIRSLSDGDIKKSRPSHDTGQGR
jgi:hypothetical protein